jgi:hypothetical protein
MAPPRSGHGVMDWTSRKLWAGQTCAVLASGPSMAREIAQAVRESGCRVIAVNDQGIDKNGKPAMAPWADILYASDATWWLNSKRDALKFAGRKVTIAQQSNVKPNVISDDVHVMGHGGVAGFDDRLTHLRTGSNSGYAATHLAIHLGATRIVLCGFDMRVVGDKAHWFGDHHWRGPHRTDYSIFLYHFRNAAQEFLKRAQVINATPGSALKCFPSMDLKEALHGVQDVRESEACVAAPVEAAVREAGAAQEAGR